MVGKWLGWGRESDTPRDGLLSSRAEWHSLSLGLAVGVIVAVVGGKDAAWLFIILSTIAFGGKKVNVGQLQHVRNEPIYALVGAVVSFLISVFVVVPNLPGGVL